MLTVPRGLLVGVGGAVALDPEQIGVGTVGIDHGDVDPVAGTADIPFRTVTLFLEEGVDDLRDPLNRPFRGGGFTAQRRLYALSAKSMNAFRCIAP